MPCEPLADGIETERQDFSGDTRFYS